MSHKTEFKIGPSTNGAGGFWLHVRRDDLDLIRAIHSFAKEGERSDLAKRMEVYAGVRLEAPDPAAPTEEAAPVAEELPAEHEKPAKKRLFRH